MNSIRLSHYGNKEDHRRGRVTGGVKTEVNGAEMQEVRDIVLRCPVDGLATLQLEQFIAPDLDVSLFGRVEPTVVLVDDSLELEVTHPAPGVTRYRAVPRG